MVAWKFNANKINDSKYQKNIAQWDVGEILKRRASWKNWKTLRYEMLEQDSYWWEVVGPDVVVPNVSNFHHSFLDNKKEKALEHLNVITRVKFS